MGKVLLILTILLTSAALAQQKYYTFSELKGMEDQAGNTHLFYKISYKNSSLNPTQYEDIIYHFDLQNNIDTAFLSDEGINSVILGMYSTQIEDYEFWDNNPAKYIYLEEDIDVDPSVIIRRFDQNAPLYNNLGEVINGNLEISGQDDSLIFANFGGTITKSTDGGYSWGRDSSWWGKQLVSLNPYNDSIFFAQENALLFRTTDTGNSFSIVDTFQTDYKQFLYDKDGNHIYRIANSRWENFLSISNNTGDANSWKKTFNDTNKLYISLYDSVSGSIFLADRNNIYYSSNYGNSFTLFKKLDHDIVGIYKKPDSNKLYAATKYKLLEINGDSVKTLKSLPIDPKIFSYYPLAVGNKWVYNYQSTNCDINCTTIKGILTREIIGDTTMKNGIKYYIVKDTDGQTYYERIDSTSGKILRYTTDTTITNNEYVIDDLIAEVGDTTFTNYRTRYGGEYAVFLSQHDTVLFDSTFPIRYYLAGQSLTDHRYSLAQGLGLISHTYEFDDGYGSETLKGAVINRVVYGDTTITAIHDQKDIPTKFNLSQNYPNPFNPTTTIKYSIPTVVDANFASTTTTRVELKVYDILGRVVANLVNKEQRPGNYEIQFNASNLASGIYFYKLIYGSYMQTRKMILLK